LPFGFCPFDGKDTNFFLFLQEKTFFFAFGLWKSGEGDSEKNYRFS
jgi:hypothetical protein